MDIGNHRANQSIPGFIDFPRFRTLVKWMCRSLEHKSAVIGICGLDFFGSEQFQSMRDAKTFYFEISWWNRATTASFRNCKLILENQIHYRQIKVESEIIATISTFTSFNP